MRLAELASKAVSLHTEPPKNEKPGWTPRRSGFGYLQTEKEVMNVKYLVIAIIAAIIVSTVFFVVLGGFSPAIDTGGGFGRLSPCLVSSRLHKVESS